MSIEKYYSQVDNSTLNESHLTNELRLIFNELKKEVEPDSEDAKILQLERDILDIRKSVDDGLQAFFYQKYTDENGKEIEILQPNFREYGNFEIEYFRRRYSTTQNNYLKSEYGLYLLIVKNLVRNDEKEELCNTIQTQVDDYYGSVEVSPEIWSRFLTPANKKWLDAFLILLRAGQPLRERFEEIVSSMQSKLLNFDIKSDCFFQVAQFVVNTFTNNSKKLETLIEPELILAKLTESINLIDESDERGVISTVKLIIKFSDAFNLKKEKSFHKVIAEVHEKVGDAEVENERWTGAVKSFEDAMQFYRIAKEDISVLRCKQKISKYRGKFKMGSVAQEADEEMLERINEHINQLLESGNVSQLMLTLAGAGVYPKASYVEQHGRENVESNSIMNLITLQSLDKYGNTTKVYRTKDERIEYHKNMFLNMSCQFGVQIIGQLLIRAIRKNKLELSHITDLLLQSWLNEEVEWNRCGDIVAIKPVSVVLPGVVDFYNQVSSIIEDDNHKLSYVCCTDSMTLKIEYILRNMCQKLEIPTFGHSYSGDDMIAEEKPLSRLVKDLSEFLRKEDVQLIRYLFNTKGGYNIRNRVAHGMMDGSEYGLSNALYAFSMIIRLALYKIPSENRN